MDVMDVHDERVSLSSTVRFPGRVALQQRLLPAYRAPFFDTLAGVCEGGLSVFAGQPLPQENVATTGRLERAVFVPAENRNFFPVYSPLYGCWQRGWREWLEDWQPDVLIVEANPRVFSNLSAIQWMHARGRPVLGWGLGVAPQPKGWRRLAGFFNPGRRWQRMSLMRALDGVIAYSQHGAQEYHAAGIPAERVFVAPNAAAPLPVHPLPKRPERFDGRGTALFVGRLQARKRIDLLLRACAGLPQEIQPRLWIVGEGPARAEFEALARSMYPEAEFLGELRGKALRPYFEAADLFVLPGTGGLAVQQAMSYGLPVIVAEGDGTQDDLVRTGEQPNGWQVPPDDVQALGQALSAALSDVSRLRRMGVESYRIVSEEINLEAMAAAFVRALCSITGAIIKE